MTDPLSRERRSWLMGRVPQKNTKPEMIVRSLAHRLGYRFRLHRRDLPGRPDLVFPKLKKAVFVHGCFWHRHGCSKATTPKSNSAYWQPKFAENVARDKRVIAELLSLGWEPMVVWECETHDIDALSRAISTFLRA
jgi:DNA mismatch endonuclease (patch repair protein)